MIILSPRSLHTRGRLPRIQRDLRGAEEEQGELVGEVGGLLQGPLHGQQVEVGQLRQREIRQTQGGLRLRHEAWRSDGLVH